jgi:farnesyl-diphosphate farnesyltransferase
LQVPSEIIEEDALGVKNAARRKLEHELGINPKDVPLDSFTWLTRVHYMGSSDNILDPDMNEPVWGEHEIDWILMCVPKKNVQINLNSNEVEATRAFTQKELKEWVATKDVHKNYVSPWFGVMEASGLLYKWWDAVLAHQTNPISTSFSKVIERDVIYRQHDLVASTMRPSSGSTSGSAKFDAVPIVQMPLAFQSTLQTTCDYAGKAVLGKELGYKLALADLLRMDPASASADAAPWHIPGAAVGGSAGAAGPTSSIVSPTQSGLKQGAYGKVKIHSESLLSQLTHIDEVVAAFQYKFGLTSATRVAPLPSTASPQLRFAESILTRVSRSFGMVIQQLPPHLRLSVGIFYLVLRGLDTVEDDTVAFTEDGNALITLSPAPPVAPNLSDMFLGETSSPVVKVAAGRTQSSKIKHLQRFHQYLEDPYFSMHNVGEADEALLLNNFFAINAVFASLPIVDKEVISDICKKMGYGMAEFANKDLTYGTQDVSEYQLYCHYVAGLVGEGLSRLFVAHGDEAPIVAADVKLADDMGRFLQKTNIIRDYLEDLVEKRAFWPKEIWALYGSSLDAFRNDKAGKDGRASQFASRKPSPSSSSKAFSSLEALEEDANDSSLACLNHLIADALTLAPSCLTYMSRLQTPDVFKFCAIPQIMAIATLAKLSNNLQVFSGVVKIRKGMALKLLLHGSSMEGVYSTFLTCSREILANIPRRHTAAYSIASTASAKIEAMCIEGLARTNPVSLETSPFRHFVSPPFLITLVGIFVGLLRYLYTRRTEWNDSNGLTYLPRITDSWDVAALALSVAILTYVIAVGGVPLVLGVTGSAQQAQNESTQFSSASSSSTRSARNTSSSTDNASSSTSSSTSNKKSTSVSSSKRKSTN